VTQEGWARKGRGAGRGVGRGGGNLSYFYLRNKFKSVAEDVPQDVKQDLAFGARVFAQLSLRRGCNWAAQWHLARAVVKRFQGCHAKCLYVYKLSLLFNFTTKHAQVTISHRAICRVCWTGHKNTRDARAGIVRFCPTTNIYRFTR